MKSLKITILSTFFYAGSILQSSLHIILGGLKNVCHSLLTPFKHAMNACAEMFFLMLVSQLAQLTQQYIRPLPF